MWVRRITMYINNQMELFITLKRFNYSDNHNYQAQLINFFIIFFHIRQVSLCCNFIFLFSCCQLESFHILRKRTQKELLQRLQPVLGNVRWVLRSKAEAKREARRANPTHISRSGCVSYSQFPFCELSSPLRHEAGSFMA